MRTASVFGVTHGRLVRVFVEVEDGETFIDGLKRFDRDHGSDLVRRWGAGEWQIIPDLVVDDSHTLVVLLGCLDDPARWDTLAHCWRGAL